MFLVVFSFFPLFLFSFLSFFYPFTFSPFFLFLFSSFALSFFYFWGLSYNTVLLGLNSPQLKIRSTTSGRACIIQIFIQLKTREEIWQQVQEELQGIVKTGSLVVMLTVRQAGTEWAERCCWLLYLLKKTMQGEIRLLRACLYV